MKTHHWETLGFCGFVLFVIILCISSNNKEANELKVAKAQNEYVEIVNRQQDSILNEVFVFLNKFEENLDSLQVSENLIYGLDPDVISKVSFQERVFIGMEQIKSRLASNRQLIDSLEDRIASFGSENIGLRKTVTQLTLRLDKKAESIALLEQSLSTAHGRIKSLGIQVNDLKETREELTLQAKRLLDTLGQNKATLAVQGSYIRNQEAQLRQGYLISGNLKELKKSGVISTSGGVAGIGKVPTLSQHMNREEFVPIDIKHLTVIPINGDKAELVSPHPASSYKIISSGGEHAIKTLEILRPDDFWSTSRYLVVLTR